MKFHNYYKQRQKIKINIIRLTYIVKENTKFNLKKEGTNINHNIKLDDL